MQADQTRFQALRISRTEWVWLAFAFVLPLSILAETIALVGVVLWVVSGPRRAFRDLTASPLVWPVLAFVFIAAGSWFWSVRPDATLDRMHRLLLPLSMFAIAGAFSGAGLRALRPAVAFVTGCAVRGVYDLVRVPFEVSRGTALFDTGNMRDPQMYLVALCLLIGMTGCREWRRYWPVLSAGILFSASGLVLHFKRGVWFAFIGAMGILGIMGKRWRVLATIGLVALCGLLHPEVRHRLAKLDEVFLASTGGRFALWRDVAPALLPQYPQGMGWCAVTHADLAEHTDYLQPKLDHLHNNLLHVALETGWLGLGAWLTWMGMLLWTLFRQSRCPSSVPHGALALGVFCAVCGLLMNGMVEYNFGDTEILLLYSLLGGIALAMERTGDQGPSG